MEHSATFCLLDIDHGMDDGKPVVRLWGKTAEGRAVEVYDRSLLPYFYVEPKAELAAAEVEELAAKILAVEFNGERPSAVTLTEKTVLGKPKRLLKVTVQTPSAVPDFWRMIETFQGVRAGYEYSIPFAKRYLIDRGLVPMGWVTARGEQRSGEWGFDRIVDAEEVHPHAADEYPRLRLMAFDIETIREDGQERIIMLSLAGNQGYRKAIACGKSGGGGEVEAVESEKALLERFVQIVHEQNPDALIGYNTDRFDLPRLLQKSQQHQTGLVLGRTGIPLNIRRREGFSAVRFHGRIHLDLFPFVRTILGQSLSSEVLTLDNVAQELVGEGKQGMSGKEIERAWRDGNIRQIASYCLQDSHLALRLAEAILPHLIELSRTTAQPLFDVSRMAYSQLVEWLLIREASRAGELVPNRPVPGETARRQATASYSGGYVYTPKEGIHENIALFDFASLYPSIILTHNISPDTLSCDCCREGSNISPLHDHYYCMQRQGFVTRVVESLIRKRARIKRRLARLEDSDPAYKKLYGQQYALKILANAVYGYYGYAGSRWYSRVCAESITAWGRSYITQVIARAQKEGFEVVYGDTDSLFILMKNKTQAREFLREVNQILPETMELEFQDLYTSGIFVAGKSGVAAKKRYALLSADGKLVIRGFERVRRDWAPLAKSVQEAVLRAVLQDKSPPKAAAIVQEVIGQLQARTVSLDDLVIYSQITRPLESYEQIGPHVAAARKARERGKAISEGTVIGYVIAPGAGSISQRAEPFEDAVEYDADYYIHHQIVPAALRILSGLGYTEDDLIGTNTQSLERFFGR